MIKYSPCKINLSLNILARREDGYHDLQTVFYPIHGRSDVLEMNPSAQDSFTCSGLIVDCSPGDNLCVRAVELLRQNGYDVPSVHIHLHKQTPFGAGLGGGSANATTVLKLANEMFALSISNETLESLAARLGSDTAYFVGEGAQVASGRGEILKPIDLNLEGYYIYIVMPPIHVSTRDAFAGISPREREALDNISVENISQWKNTLENDFEATLFPKYPLLQQIKTAFYDAGAIYASLSGSGAALYGIFSEKPSVLPTVISEHLWHVEQA